MTRQSRRRLLQQIESLEPNIRRAFLEAIAAVAAGANVGLIEAMIRDNRAGEILAGLALDAAVLARLTEAIRSAFVAGGEWGTKEMPPLRSRVGGTFRLLFNVRNPRAEAWLREESSRLVTAILDDQRELIRQLVSEGTRLGRNPRATALDLVGRIAPGTQRRTGGVIGLTSQQAGWVQNARAQLLSGDPEAMTDYFNRQLRDRRFDGIVRRAIAAERPVKAADVDRITGRYADRLLRHRGENIARTEAMAAFNTARDEAYLQAIDTGAVQAQNVVKTWQSAGDSRVRDSHTALSGQKRAINEPFRSPTGALLKHPGDASLGAGAADLANCRCSSRYTIRHLDEALG